MPIEPETKIVQRHFGGQASLKPRQVMRTFPCQPKGIQELVVDGFDDLPQAGQPATQGFGPMHASTRLMRWSHQIDLVLLVPSQSWPRARKAFVGHIRSVSRQATAAQLGRRRVASSKQGGCQVLIMRTRASKAKAGNDALSRDAQQEMEAFVPAKAITPADIGLTSQPAGAAPFRVACDGGGAIEDFVGTALGLQHLHQKQGESRDRIAVRSLQPIELAAVGQLRKRFWQVPPGIAVKRSFTGKLHPLSKQCQRDHLTSAQRGQRARFGLLWLPFPLAKIVHHNVQCSQEGIQIHSQRAPFLTNWFDKLTVWSGSLLFQVLSISHQTFKKNYEPRCDLAHLALQNMESFQPKLIFLHRLLPENREPMNGDAASYESG